MPSVKAKSPPKPKAPKVETPPQPKPEREVLYDKEEVKLCRGDKALTVEQVKTLLGWETEKEFTTRTLRDSPNTKPEAAMFKGGGTMDQHGETFPVLLTDYEGNKVICWNNSRNRPFDETHAKKLAQVILNRQWRFNLENIIIGRTGIVESGQHRGVALILAYQQWAGLHDPKEKGAAGRAQHVAEHWKSLWPTEPTLETSIAFGADESAETLQTLDNVKPRSLSDIFYVSPLFAELLPEGRNECSRMLQRAVELLWKRTHQGREDVAGGVYSKYMTHTASMDFVERHPKILDCVHHIFNCNKGRGISLLKLSPGQCAAMLYLMASCEDDGDDYRNSDPPREEGLLKFSLWKTARSFWVEMSRKEKTNTQFLIIHEALSNPISPSGDAVKLVEKMVVIARAWEEYAGGQPFGLELVQLQDSDYQVDEHGQKHLQLEECPTFGGIDAGEARERKVTKAEVEAGKAEVDGERTAEDNAKRIEALKTANAKRKASKKGATAADAEAQRLQDEIDRLQKQAGGGVNEESEEGDGEPPDEDDFSMEDDEELIEA